ncbi:MAG: T9SS type A sorting domain-containing protein [FCB group bacterium]|nr:T9SS type A sorting domain-containing protein [FCB group bacterium]
MLCCSRLAAEALPLRFDLRNAEGVNYVSPVKSQRGGTCWTHAVMAAMESNMMIGGAASFEPDLSEYHLDWWNGFNLYFNEDIGMYPAEGLEVHMGGDYRVASAYLARGDGAIMEPPDGPFYDDPPAFRDSSYQYYYARHILWHRLEDDLSNIDLIKRQIMEHGAAGTCMYVGTEFLDDSIGGTFWQPPWDPNDPNHAIAIIGWDDSIRTAAPEPGAWLCKNSWGTSWGNAWGGEGYFWISYYDKHAVRHPEMGFVSFQHVESMRYDKIYYHDYHGWRDTLAVHDAFNAFVADDRDTLVAVSFYTAADSVSYTIKLYRSRADIEQDQYKASHTGLIPHPGFHTVDMDSGFLLVSDDSFFVHLHLDKGGHAHDRTSVVPVLLGPTSVYALNLQAAVVPSRAAPGESFYLDNGVWYDLQEMDTTANFCIKALVRKNKFTYPNPPPSFSGLMGVYPNPFSRRAVIDFNLSETATVLVQLYDIRGRLIRTLKDDRRSAGYHWSEYDLSDLSNGIYICILKVDGRLADSRKIMMIK